MYQKCVQFLHILGNVSLVQKIPNAIYSHLCSHMVLDFPLTPHVMEFDWLPSHEPGLEQVTKGCVLNILWFVAHLR